MLIPFRTDRPRIRPAYLTIGLIVVNTLIQIYSMILPPEVVSIGMGGQWYQAEESSLVLHYGLWGSHPTLLTLFTHMFLHGDLFHLAGNMLFLWLFGSLIEDVLRPWGMAALYLGGGMAAAWAHIGICHALGVNLNVPMVGASGAIAAIMGLFLLRFYKTRVEFFYWLRFSYGTFWVQSIWVMLIWVGIEVLEGVLDSAGTGGGVAHWAHVGGFAAGALVAPFIGSLGAAKQEYFSDDPADNVEYLRRAEQAAAAERALRADPNNAYLMRRLAQTYRHAGEFQRATETYQRSLASFARRNLMEQATDVYLELLEYDAGTKLPPELQLKVAQQLEKSHLARAAAAYRLLTEQQPAPPEAEFALLRLAALSIQRLDRPYEGARYLDQFLQLYPNSRWAAAARQVREQLGQ